MLKLLLLLIAVGAGFHVSLTGAVVATILWLILFFIISYQRELLIGFELIAPCIVLLWATYGLVMYEQTIHTWVVASMPALVR